MATARKKARQRISYVLPLAQSTGGHRLGVNSLAVDRDNSILYSAGRDGTLLAWDLNLPLDASHSAQTNTTPTPAQASVRRQLQAHTHWVNDISLVQNNSALVSASSDCSVKLWRPHSEESRLPTTIGLHTDYVKCLASPGPSLDWVASGGLDHKIRIWDIGTGQQKLEINALEQEKDNAKGSVYALNIAGGVMASGGPEGVVRVWDYRSGRRITKFVGHTDKLNSILINDLGDTVMTASSDRTIKVWSLAAGRCMHTLTMHNDSVWSLWSNHPDFAVFYSTDRSGLIAKTDVRYSQSLDEALSVVVAKEHHGVSNVALAGDYIWTATASSSINRWRNVSTELETNSGPRTRYERHGSLASRTRGLSDAQARGFQPDIPAGISEQSVLRTTDAARFSASVSRFQDLEGAAVKPSSSGRKQSGKFLELDSDEGSKPVRDKPEETIEGQNGLTRHVLLHDRRRVLTVDTAGEIMLWDLIKCAPIKSFGKRHLDDVADELAVQESVPNWCTLDTRTGQLSVALEENYAFEAEVYADDLGLDHQEGVEPNDQQRIIYGKWILRWLFDGLVQEEIRRDRRLREDLSSKQAALGANNPDVPKLELLPDTGPEMVEPNLEISHGISSRPATNGTAPLTPGFGIGLATPAIPVASPGQSAQSPLLTAKTPGTELEKSPSRLSGDYFSRGNGAASHQPTSAGPASKANETEETQDGGTEAAKSPTDEKEGKSSFFSSKNFRMKFPKKLGRTSEEVSKPTDDKASDAEKTSIKEDPTFEDNFLGTVQGIRHTYEEQLLYDPATRLTSLLRLPPVQDTPHLRIPPNVDVVIQEERPDSGGVVDLHRSTVATVGEEADELEKVAPQWLGELLLRNTLPTRDPNRAKQPFVLLPMNDALPNMANGEGNSRLTAPRVLRAKKVLEYIGERLNPPEKPVAPDGPPVEDYLELYCQNQLISTGMTLATIRQFVWKSGGDIVLYYKSNGKWPAFDKHYQLAGAEAAHEEVGEDFVTVEGEPTDDHDVANST